jgi:FkbM family methyltransferase
MRIKRSDYLAECKGLNFELHAHSHEWYTLYENVIREDYFLEGVSLRDGETVIDIGAHFGSFSAIASKKIGPTGKVIAFEPNPEIYPRLARNIAINSLDNVVLHNEAVSGEDGKLVLFLQQRSSLATTYPKVDLEDRVSQSTRSVTVPARSMRSILRSIGGPVDLLKIDCEGAE